MTRVAVLTPDPSDSSYASHWPLVLERLGEALALTGIEAVPTPWTAHIEDASGLKDYPLVLALIVWGYHRTHADWMKATRTWEEAGLRLANPATVLGWNSNKAYLARLETAGIPIPPTIWTDHATQAGVNAAFDRLGADTLIVKPAVSGGAWKTTRLNRGEALTDAPSGRALIQPYLPTIETEGETSLLFFGGRFSHAVNKRPASGDFRIQVQYGGLYETVTPPPAALALAEQVLAAVEEPLLYARIDMTPDGSGGWLLMEAELIEPDFYLGNDPTGGRLFAEAVRARLGA